ncbi:MULTISPECIES: LutC/YkgG family protein [Marinobacter]|uniref:LutC/YkgG family protein n=1 Tax=Marinobacter TaxID=2742 RepID=UPI001D078EC6|nr:MULTISPECIES: lactate utilization protein [Marinobacter]MCG8519909.1 lactate utilization protein [Pseudomonadales bacterium]MCK7565312.1 lactate utilization protein [Marinobacter xestospongiae]UDL06087.1 lactate utilization protein [Marinobacter sp. CA1]
MNARKQILDRLRAATDTAAEATPLDFTSMERPPWSQEECLQRFEQTLESVHGEVHRVDRAHWLLRLAEILQARKVRNLLAPVEHPLGQALRQSGRDDLPTLLAYDQVIEAWQPSLFNDVDASLTSTLGGIAETGSLILWPTRDEPRLMSLVPPIHIAVLDADQLYSTFLDALRQQGWSAGMPTNALLISGPSKTADIEQTLAYGVHGPRELIVLVLG